MAIFRRSDPPSVGEVTKIAPEFPQLSDTESYSLYQRVGLRFGQERGGGG
jgi:hypothetical protein